MKMSLPLLQFALLAPLCAAAAEPVFVLVEHSPWKVSVAPETPTFAMYDDGTVIYRKQGEAGRSLYFTARVDLDSPEMDPLKPTDRSLYEESYVLTRLGDQPQSIFYWPDTQVRVYGRVKQNAELYSSNPMLEDINREERQLRQKLPDGITAAYAAAKEFDAEGASEWRPEFVEVLIWPFEHATDAPVPWPEDWPGLDDARTVERGVEAYSLYLQGDQIEKLETFLSERSPRSAVIINGRKWNLIHRFPFPGEAAWRESVAGEAGSGWD